MITSKPEQIVDTIIIWFYSFNNNNTFFFVFPPKRMKGNSRVHFIQYIGIIYYTGHEIRMTWIQILDSPVYEIL